MVRRRVDNDGICATGSLLSPEDARVILEQAFRIGIETRGRVNAQVGATTDRSIRTCREWSFDPHYVHLADGSGLTERLYWGFNAGNFAGLAWLEVPSVRIVEYTAGNFYRRHTDWSPGAGRLRKLSMSVQMTDGADYVGGDVILYAGPMDEKLPRSIGTFGLWPAWVLHEVSEVTSGCRYAMVAWAQGEPFK